MGILRCRDTTPISVGQAIEIPSTPFASAAVAPTVSQTVPKGERPTLYMTSSRRLFARTLLSASARPRKSPTGCPTKRSRWLSLVLPICNYRRDSMRVRSRDALTQPDRGGERTTRAPQQVVRPPQIVRLHLIRSMIAEEIHVHEFLPRHVIQRRHAADSPSLCFHVTRAAVGRAVEAPCRPR